MVYKRPLQKRFETGLKIQKDTQKQQDNSVHHLYWRVNPHIHDACRRRGDLAATYFEMRCDGEH